MVTTSSCSDAPGVGKTHLAVSLDLKAIEAGYRVLFTTAATLIEKLTEYADSEVAGICRLRRRRCRPSAGRITPTLKWPDYAGR